MEIFQSAGGLVISAILPSLLLCIVESDLQPNLMDR
uniref:Uncharacterized protein n=1 Tax=Arundo donax TaxID=35708 RepID=A0A0A9ER61_ARUDO